MSKRIHPTYLWLALCAGAAASCAAPANPTTPATPTVEPPTATAAPVSAASPPGRDDATPDASTQPPTPDLGPSPLHVAGEHDTPFQLFGLGDVGFLRVGDKLLEVRDDHVKYDRAPNRGLPSGDAYENTIVAGNWPDTAFVVATRTDRNRRRSELFFWDGHRWKSKFQTRKSTVIRALSPWNLRRVLALLQNVEDDTPSFKVIAGFPIAPVPQPSKSDEDGCKTRIKLQDAAILRTGHVFATGHFCGAKSQSAAVERWEPNEKRGDVSELPDSAGVKLSGIVATSPTHVVVAGASDSPQRPAYLALFDGTAWKSVETPMRTGIARLVAGPGGALWAVTGGGALWKQPPNGSWLRVPMPPKPNESERIEAVSLWPHTAEDTWVVGRYQAKNGEQRTVLLHTRKHEGPVPFDTDE